jgi:hypothetical protein
MGGRSNHQPYESKSFMNHEQGAERSELHPFFPSGEWEGFYTYSTRGAAEKHPMHFTLLFKDNVVTGTGGDDLGSFSWKGAYCKEQLTCSMTKHYHNRHSVSYRGQVDENGIWGTWLLWGATGGFHIWPKAREKSEQAEESLALEETVPQKVYVG